MLFSGTCPSGPVVAARATLTRRHGFPEATSADLHGRVSPGTSRLAIAVLDEYPRRKASMGPRSFDRGREAEGDEEEEFEEEASMGPRSFDRGRTTWAARSPTPWPRLQWGLGLSTEEGTRRNVVHGVQLDASMGPRSFDRGRPDYPIRPKS